MMTGMDLEGRVALVTGGGHRLGKAITEALAEAGCQLVVHYGESGEAAEATVTDLASRGVEAIAVGADLEVETRIEEMFDQVEERFGRLHILINSAATFLKSPLGELQAEDWDRVMAVNLRAPFLCMRQAIPLLRAAERHDGAPAAVINVADLSGIQPWPGYAHHGASKAGLLQLTRAAARELAPEIRVNAVVPGPVLPPPGVSPEVSEWQDLVSGLPAGRCGRPAEVGSAVVFLAGNDFILGETLCIDGGEHLIGAGRRHL